MPITHDKWTCGTADSVFCTIACTHFGVPSWVWCRQAYLTFSWASEIELLRLLFPNDGRDCSLPKQNTFIRMSGSMTGREGGTHLCICTRLVDQTLGLMHIQLCHMIYWCWWCIATLFDHEWYWCWWCIATLLDDVWSDCSYPAPLTASPNIAGQLWHV